MGVGLGLLTGSGLRLLAPRVQQQEIALPSWLADQALITTLLGDAVEPLSSENATGEKLFVVAEGLKQARSPPGRKSGRCRNAGWSWPRNSDRRPAPTC